MDKKSKYFECSCADEIIKLQHWEEDCQVYFFIFRFIRKKFRFNYIW
jgi:hypothetical protein